MPALTFYTNLFPRRFAGYTFGPLILIRPQYRGDAALLAHEQAHVRQFWRSWGTAGLWYWLSPAARLRYELEAYRAEVRVAPEHILQSARHLCDLYGFTLTMAEAVALLRQPGR